MPIFAFFKGEQPYGLTSFNSYWHTMILFWTRNFLLHKKLHRVQNPIIVSNFGYLGLILGFGHLCSVFIDTASYGSRAIMLSCWVSVTIEYKQPQPKTKSAKFYPIVLALGFGLFRISSVIQCLVTISWNHFQCYCEISMWSLFPNASYCFFQSTTGCVWKNKALPYKNEFKSLIGASWELAGKMFSLKKASYHLNQQIML